MKHNALWKHLDGYWEAIQASGLADSSKVDYYYFAEVFVRWVEGDFTPGGVKDGIASRGSGLPNMTSQKST